MVWPENGKRVARKQILLVLAPFFWIGLLRVMQVFRVGDISFYETYVEVTPLFGFEPRRIYYDEMHARITRGSVVLLSHGYEKPWWKNPFKYWLTTYWNSIIVSFDMPYYNPESLPVARQIIDKHSVTIEDF